MKPGTTNFPRASISVVADRDVAAVDLAGDQIQRPRVLDHQIGAGIAERLIDPPFQAPPRRFHRCVPAAGANLAEAAVRATQVVL